ncbi:MAG: HD domain-containing protein [Desulfobacterales bacterium]|nr:HD domain-containing protein [Desulfobacterales bacterium]
MNNTDLLDFFHNIGKLKAIKRTGWLMHSVENPESVAEHSYRTAVMAMVLGDHLKLNLLKLLKMSLIHDMAEITIGDITPRSEITREEKIEKEKQALKQLIENLPNADHYFSLWIEYENQASPEAILLKNIDKLEMLLQAVEYQQRYPHKNLQEFFSDADHYITIPEIRELLEEIKASIDYI